MCYGVLVAFIASGGVGRLGGVSLGVSERYPVVFWPGKGKGEGIWYLEVEANTGGGDKRIYSGERRDRRGRHPPSQPNQPPSIPGQL